MGENHENGNKVDKGLKHITRICEAVIVVIIAVCLIFGTHFSLTENEQAVVETFGKPAVVDSSGWHWKIPFIQKYKKLTKSVMGMAVGYDAETGDNLPDESIMITSDFNFVDIDFYIDYRISDPVEYIKNRENAEFILKNLAQSYIRDTIGTFKVDSVITTGKTEIESIIEEKLRERVDEENIGLYVENVLMQDAEMPTYDIQVAFKAVEDAIQSMSTRENEANMYKNEQLPAAEAKADAIIKKAETTKEARIQEAEGKVAKFNDMYEEYVKYPLITKQRMFYETFADTVKDLKVIINTSDGTQTVLPLSSFTSTSTSAE